MHSHADTASAPPTLRDTRATDVDDVQGRLRILVRPLARLAAQEWTATQRHTSHAGDTDVA